jgi:hypothetical protein
MTAEKCVNGVVVHVETEELFGSGAIGCLKAWYSKRCLLQLELKSWGWLELA